MDREEFLKEMEDYFNKRIKKLKKEIKEKRRIKRFEWRKELELRKERKEKNLPMGDSERELKKKRKNFEKKMWEELY